MLMVCVGEGSVVPLAALVRVVAGIAVVWYSLLLHFFLNTFPSVPLVTAPREKRGGCCAVLSLRVPSPVA